MQIIARKIKRCAYPPIGVPIPPQPPLKDFEAVRIKKAELPERLRPEGARQSTAEANVLMKIIAIQQNRAMAGGDIISR